MMPFLVVGGEVRVQEKFVFRRCFVNVIRVKWVGEVVAEKGETVFEVIFEIGNRAEGRKRAVASSRFWI